MTEQTQRFRDKTVKGIPIMIVFAVLTMVVTASALIYVFGQPQENEITVGEAFDPLVTRNNTNGAGWSSWQNVNETSQPMQYLLFPGEDVIVQYEATNRASAILGFRANCTLSNSTAIAFSCDDAGNDCEENIAALGTEILQWTAVVDGGAAPGIYSIDCELQRLPQI